MNTKLLKLNEFYIRLIAIITMTFDHVGVFLMMYMSQLGGVGFENPIYVLAFIFRCIGRIAMPLFILMVVEGVRHTSHFGKYMLRMGSVALAVLIAQIVIYYAFDTSIEGAMSPFVDLLLIALMVYLLRRKDNYRNLAILPIAYLLLSYIVPVVEIANNINVLWFPFYLRAGYSLFALLLGLAFYYSGVISYKTISKHSGIEEESIITTMEEYRALGNVLNCLALAFVGVLIFLSAYVIVNDIPIFDVYGANIQSYCFIAIIPLYLYNGYRGYNKTWFKYFSYLYYPVHIVILFMIFYLIFI